MTFPLGRVVATPAALALLSDAGISPHSLLLRHQSGDWGDLYAEDKKANVDALGAQGRILSVYQITEHERVYVITEWDRSYTTILLTSEY